MATTNQETRYADRRDDYRNGFVDAVAYLRGQFPPTELQIAAALNELQGFRHRTALLGRQLASTENSHCSPIDALSDSR